MRTWSRLAAVLVGLSLLAPLPACGKKGPSGGPTLEKVSSDVSGLVPSDAVVLVYAPSLDRLIQKVRKIADVVAPAQAHNVSLDALLGEFPPEVRQQFDPTKPIAVAAVLPPGGEPVPTVLIPARDATVLSQQLSQLGTTTTAGKYVSLTVGPAPAKRGGSAVADRVPEGDLAFRVDLARVAPILGQQLAARLEGMDPEAGRPNPAAPFLDAANQFLTSAEWLDVALKIDQTNVEFVGEFRAKEGSALAKAGRPSDRLAKLAGRLPKDFPLTMAVAIDVNTMIDLFEKLFSSIQASAPSVAKPDVPKLMAQVREISRHMTGEQVAGMGFGPVGMEGVVIGGVKDTKAYMEATARIVTEMPKIYPSGLVTVAAIPEETIDGVAVQGWTMNMDMAAMSGGDDLPPEAAEASSKAMRAVLGPEGWTWRIATVEGAVVMTMGGGRDLMAQSIASAKKGGSVPPGLKSAIDRAGGKPTLALHADARALLSGFFDMMRKAMPPEAVERMPNVPAGRPVPLLAYLTADGRTYRGGLSTDVAAWAELIKSLEK